MSIKIEIEVNEANVLFNALSQMPYGQVEQLMNKLRMQIVPQVQSTQPPPTAPAAE